KDVQESKSIQKKLVRQLNDIELFKELGMIEEIQTEMITRQIKGLTILSNSESHALEGNIHFEEKKLEI
ncbi:13398_t:CDS:1, partial [Funneliformis geosporum]